MPDISAIDISEGEWGRARQRVGGGCETEERKKESKPKQRLQFPAPPCTLDRCGAGAALRIMKKHVEELMPS